MKPERTVEVFVSYAHEDEELWNELSKHLSILKRRNVISVWHDRQIGAGREWKNEIGIHLNTADIILLLVSADFLASEYCYDVEMRRAIERHEAREARVIPVILRDCDLEQSVFRKLNYLPADGKPVTNPKHWSTRDEAFRNVAEGIRRAVEELIESKIGVLLWTMTRAESQRNFPNAIEIGERILRMAPEHKTTRSKIAAAYIKKWSRCFDESFQHIDGHVQLKTKRHEDYDQVRQKIVADLNRAIELESNNAEYYYLRFSIAGNESDIERAIELDPSTAQYYLARATTKTDDESRMRDRQRASELGWEGEIIPRVLDPDELLESFRNPPKPREIKERWDELLESFRNPPKPRELKERWRLKCLRD